MKDSFATVEGGEIGSGYSMIGIFEVEPAVSRDTILIEKFAQINLHYRLPNDTAHQVFSYRSIFDFVEFAELEKPYRFAATVAMFGSLLRSSPFIKTVNWNDVSQLAIETANLSDGLQKEFVALVEQAKSIYTRGKKKKRDKDD
jgi:Ca-activated chloride channel family protein